MGIKPTVAANLSDMKSFFRSLLDGVFVIVVLLLLLYLYGWMLERDTESLQKQSHESKQSEQKAWATVAHILNGNPVKVDERTALFVEVHEERDLCSAC